MRKDRVAIPLFLLVILSMILFPAIACTIGEEDPTPTPTKEVKTTPYQYDIEGKVIVDGSPVRDGPGSGYTKLGTLKKDVKVTITGVSSDKNWYRIKTPSGIDPKGKECWISILFVQQTPSQ
jgi:uncharacterized protein YgiM (DUF1202 family)